MSHLILPDAIRSNPFLHRGQPRLDTAGVEDGLIVRFGAHSPQSSRLSPLGFFQLALL